MRTTLTLPNDLLEATKSLARQQGISVGEALAALARRGLERENISYSKAFPCFAIPPDAPSITLDHTLNLEDED